jgi:hypothetical protein
VIQIFGKILIGVLEDQPALSMQLSEGLRTLSNLTISLWSRFFRIDISLIVVIGRSSSCSMLLMCFMAKIMLLNFYTALNTIPWVPYPITFFF